MKEAMDHRWTEGSLANPCIPAIVETEGIPVRSEVHPSIFLQVSVPLDLDYRLYLTRPILTR